MKKMILAGLLSVGAASAQITGEYGRAIDGGMMNGYGMMGYGGFGSILGTLLFVGLTLLVWLWVVKLWKEVRRMK